jgi:hypothetical protein
VFLLRAESFPSAQTITFIPVAPTMTVAAPLSGALLTHEARTWPAAVGCAESTLEQPSFNEGRSIHFIIT